MATEHRPEVISRRMLQGNAWTGTMLDLEKIRTKVRELAQELKDKYGRNAN